MSHLATVEVPVETYQAKLNEIKDLRQQLQEAKAVIQEVNRQAKRNEGATKASHILLNDLKIIKELTT